MKGVLLLGALFVSAAASAQSMAPAYGQPSVASGVPEANATNRGIGIGSDFRPTRQEEARALKRQAAKQELLARRAAKAKAPAA